MPVRSHVYAAVAVAACAAGLGRRREGPGRPGPRRSQGRTVTAATTVTGRAAATAFDVTKHETLPSPPGISCRSSGQQPVEVGPVGDGRTRSGCPKGVAGAERVWRRTAGRPEVDRGRGASFPRRGRPPGQASAGRAGRHPRPPAAAAPRTAPTCGTSRWRTSTTTRPSPTTNCAATAAALAKLVNSLSWKPEVVVPEAVDTAADRLRRGPPRRWAGTSATCGGRCPARYPYGLKHDEPPGPATCAAGRGGLRRGRLRPARSSGPTGSSPPPRRPPLYHTLLRPARRHARELEKQLERGRRGQLPPRRAGPGRLRQRAGCPATTAWSSGTTPPTAPTGRATTSSRTAAAATCSASRSARAFAGNPFADQAFEHDGGEIIFNLPNGLQGYLLVDGKGERIDEGPIEIVSDASKTPARRRSSTACRAWPATSTA